MVNLSIYYTWKNIKSAYDNKIFKISAPTSNNEFDLPDGSYSISDIQDCFEFIIKKHETLAENRPIQIYPNKIRIVFKIKTGYKLEILSPETIKLLESTEKDVDNDKDSQQTFVGLQDVFKTSSRHFLKTSSIRLQRNNFSSSKTS